MLLLICNNELLEWKDRKITRYQSPRRLRAKYTPRTNLRFMLSVFRPCREQSHAGVTYTNAVAFGYAGYGNEFTTISLILSVHLPFPLSEEGEESTLTTRHSFIQMTKLSNVRGRITYISSHGCPVCSWQSRYSSFHTCLLLRGLPAHSYPSITGLYLRHPSVFTSLSNLPFHLYTQLLNSNLTYFFKYFSIP